MSKVLLSALIVSTAILPVAHAADGRGDSRKTLSERIWHDRPAAPKPVARKASDRQRVVRVPGYRDSFGRLRHTIHHGGHRYLFDQGRFLRQSRTGYVVVAAPVGAVVPALPAAQVLFDYGRRPVFKFEGVYYRQVADGYAVIKWPMARSE